MNFRGRCRGIGDWIYIGGWVLEEGALSVSDVLYRRNRSALWAPDTARAAAEPVARRMAELLGWDDARARAEVDALRGRMAADLSFAKGPR